MRIIDRYVARQVITGSLLALFVLTGIAVFFTFLAQLGDLNQRYTLGKAIAYVLLSLPRRAYELLPTAVLLGSLMGLGALASSSELVVLRAAGVSVARVGLSVLKAGLAVGVFALLLGEVVAPPGEQYAQQMKSAAMTGAITLRSRHGFWARDGQNYVSISRVLPGARLENIVIYRYDDSLRLRSVTHAPHAEFRDGRWLLRDIRQTRFSDAGAHVEVRKQAWWSSILAPELLDVLVVKPLHLSAWSLMQYIRYLRLNSLDTQQYSLALWVKLMQPFTAMAMLLLAVPFVFGSLRSTGAGQRMLVGVLIGMGFHLASQAIHHTGLVYGAPAALSAATPVVLMVLTAWWMMRRAERV